MLIYFRRDMEHISSILSHRQAWGLVFTEAANSNFISKILTIVYVCALDKIECLDLLFTVSTKRADCAEWSSFCCIFQFKFE